MNFPVIEIALPEWAEKAVDSKIFYHTDRDKMSLAVKLAVENVKNETGGPFGAAIFESDTGRLLSIGINQVTRLNNSNLHAEVTAIMIAQRILKTYSLNTESGSRYELFTSCEPCCMCLGAVLWSGVKRMVCGATKSDAMKIGFDEGPVFEASYDYLRDRDIEIQRSFMREEAAEAFALYTRSGGVIYNG